MRVGGANAADGSQLITAQGGRAFWHGRCQGSGASHLSTGCEKNGLQENATVQQENMRLVKVLAVGGGTGEGEILREMIASNERLLSEKQKVAPLASPSIPSKMSPFPQVSLIWILEFSWGAFTGILQSRAGP